MAVVKCTQLKGLADTADYTCKSQYDGSVPNIRLIISPPLVGTWELVIWTK